MPITPHATRPPGYAPVLQASVAEMEDEDGADAIDLLQDHRWQPFTWFSDFAFATRRYAYGALVGTPTHLPPPDVLRSRVVASAQEMEDAQGAGTNETSTASDLLYRMMSKPTMLAVRFLGWVLGKLWRAAFTSVLLHNASMVEEALRRADKRTALVILPTHRSHADYLLMSYIFFGLDLGVPLIAAGDNLNVSLLGSLLSRAGAFFIKRTSGTPRYRFVLQAYLQELAKSGAPIEFFIEGGRSRRGHVGKPKVGLLGIIIDLVRDGELDDALLIPCSLDYDAVPEAGAFANEVLGTGEKKPESLFGTIKGGIEWLLYGARGGSVYVGFADRPLSVKDLLARAQRIQQGKAVVTELMLNRPLAIFRGGSNTSLNGQDLDEQAVNEIGKLVCRAQREAALVTVAGVVACVILGSDHHGKPVDRESMCLAVLRIVAMLVDLGYANRIPKGTLTPSTVGADVDRAMQALGGALGPDVKSRLRLRYVAAPVVVRLLPWCMAAFDGKGPELGAWLGELMDVGVNEVLVADLEAPPTSQVPLLRTLVAPLVLVLSAVLTDVATWRADVAVKEDLVVARVRDGLVSAATRFPETGASLEIIAALRACVSRGVLTRNKVDDPASKKAKFAYQLVAKTGADALRQAMVAIDMARLNL